MEFNSDFYFQLEASAGPLYHAMSEAAQKSQQPRRHPLLQVQNGRAESPAWYLIQAAEFDPDPLTIDNIRIRDTYASESIASAILEMLAAEKWLDRRDDEYHLTAAGRDVTDELLSRSQSLLTGVTIPTHIDVARLEHLLRRVINACLDCDNPPGNWCLVHSRNRAPDDEKSVVVRLLHYFSDFNAFRDDAHMAAWQPTGVTGNHWETFAYVIAGLADTSISLYEQLSYRGYSIEDYDDALLELVTRGWISYMDKSHVVTDAGATIHAQVESLTDQYFYAPWFKELSEAELTETGELLRVLREDWTRSDNI